MRRRRHFSVKVLVFVNLALVLVTAPGHTQELALVVGERVRFSYSTAEPNTRLSGTVIALDRDSLTMDVMEGTDVTRTIVALQTINQLAVSTGWGNAAGTGRLVGSVGGALLGWLVAVVLPDRECHRISPFRLEEVCTGLITVERLVGLVLPGTIIGGATGHFVGKSIRVELWEPIWVEGMVVGPSVQGSGGLALTIQFRL